MIAVAAIVVVIVVIVAALFFFGPKFSSKADNAVESELKKAGEKVGPQAEFTTVEKTLNPPKTEDFVEYMTTDQETETGKLIDIGLRWKTTTGFEDVEMLVFKRTVNGEEIQEAIEYTGEGVDNYSSGEILFDGENITSSPVGENKIEVYYTKKDSDEQIKLTEIIVNVDQKDLAMTTELLAPKTMEFTPKTKDDSFAAELVSEKVFYVLKPNSGKSIVIDGRKVIDTPFIFTLDIKKTGDDDVVAFKFMDEGDEDNEPGEKPLSIDGNTDFILKKKKQDIYFLTTADGKAVTTPTPSNNKISNLVILPFENMTPLQYRASMFKIADTKSVVKFPKEISGLSGRYVTNSMEPDKWNDISGRKNHCTEVKGSLKKTDSYVYGNFTDGFRFPKATLGADNVYTLFYVARYNGINRGRIFDGIDGNWLSGFHNNNTAIAHHGNWLAYPGKNYSIHSQSFFQGTDQNNVFRTNGENRVTNADHNGTTSQITVNHGQFPGESTDWAIKEVLIYNRKLSAEEIVKVEQYLEYTYPEYKNDPSSVLFLDPEEKHRSYSDFWGRGGSTELNQSKISSGSSWSALRNDIPGDHMKIDLEHKYKIVGVVIRGRAKSQGYAQYPKKVMVAVNDTDIQEFDTDGCYDNHKICMFNTPVLGREVKFTMTDFNQHKSMRAGVIIETGEIIKYKKNANIGYTANKGVTYPTPQEDPVMDAKAAGPLSCMKHAEANKDKYVSWGFRTFHHPTESLKGTCWFYKTLPEFEESNETIAAGKSVGSWDHLLGCTNSKNGVFSGCAAPFE